MSKLYKKYLELKASQNYEPNTLFLFRSGLFFIFLDDDAKLVSNLLDLKLCPLNDTVMKCGFPATSLQKYLNLLKNTPFHIEFVTLENSNPINSHIYVCHKEIQSILSEILNVNVEHLSISEIYDFLSKIQQQLSLLNEEFNFDEMKNKKQ